MPDYLGKDQRRTKEGEDEEEKPITSEGRPLLYLFILSLGLDEGDIQILKTYVRYYFN